MQIVIDISEEDYERLKEYKKAPFCSLTSRAYEAIANGTLLPKHGRLGDLSKVYVALNEAQIEGTEEYKGLGKAKQIVCDAETIIEADNEESENTNE